MKLQDYLSYYLGCKCKTYAGSGRLTSFDIDSGHWYVSLDTGGGTVGNINDTYRECPEESKQAFPNGYPPKSILKPILHKLDDITDEQFKDYLNWGRLNELYENVRYEKCEHAYILRYDIPVDIGAYPMNDTIDFIKLLPDQFRWLCKHGFDLFGLIENGLAIDSKTLTT